MLTHPWSEDRYAEKYEALEYKLKKLRELEHITKKTTG